MTVFLAYPAFLKTIHNGNKAFIISVNITQCRHGSSLHFVQVFWKPRGPGSSVGIATDYGLDGTGSNPGVDEIFRPSRPALGPTQAPAVCLQSLSVKVVQWSSASQRAASERKWLCVVWFTILLVWVQNNGVGTRELWVNDRTLWFVSMILKAPEFQLLISTNGFSNNCTCRKM